MYLRYTTYAKIRTIGDFHGVALEISILFCGEREIYPVITSKMAPMTFPLHLHLITGLKPGTIPASHLGGAFYICQGHTEPSEAWRKFIVKFMNIEVGVHTGDIICCRVQYEVCHTGVLQ